MPARSARFAPRTAFAAALALASLGGASACDVSKTLDANKNKLDITIPVVHTITVTIDADKVLGTLAGQIAAADLAQDVTTPGQAIDLIKTEPKLAQYKSKVKSIKVTGITATPTANSLSGNLPALDLVVGAPGLAKPTDGAKLASLPVIPPASTAAVTAVVDAGNATAASKFLTTLQFDAMTVTKLVVKKGEKVPGGKVELKLELKLDVVVSPL